VGQNGSIVRASGGPMPAAIPVASSRKAARDPARSFSITAGNYFFIAKNRIFKGNLGKKKNL
jgi:hypothetical protein